MSRQPIVYKRRRRQLKILSHLLRAPHTTQEMMTHFHHVERRSVKQLLTQMVKILWVTRCKIKKNTYVYEVRDRTFIYSKCLWLEDKLWKLSPEFYEDYQKKDSNDNWILYPELEDKDPYV